MQKRKQVDHNLPRAAYSIDEACHITSLSRTRLYEEMQRGRLKAIKSGRRTLITPKAIDDLLTTLEEAV